MPKPTTTSVLKSPSLLARFMAKVDQSDTCWTWIGAKYSNGYGHIHCDGRTMGAHRVSYMLFRGDIPLGLEIDHLCSNRPCVNPAHLEVVTHRENMHRTPRSVFAVQAAKTHCVRNHEYTPQNTITRPDRPGTRACRTCHNQDTKAAARRKREARNDDS